MNLLYQQSPFSRALFGLARNAPLVYSDVVVMSLFLRSRLLYTCEQGLIDIALADSRLYDNIVLTLRSIYESAVI